MTGRKLILALAAAFVAALPACAPAQPHVGMGVGPTHQHGRPPGGAGGGSSPFQNPVLTQTSAAGTNPPAWDSVMPNLQDGDTVQLDFTSNGSNPDGTAEASHTVISFDETITWTTFTGFAGGATVKWSERYGRTISGTPTWSNWSNILSDVMAAGAWSPSSLFGASEYGFALDPTNAGNRFTDSACTTAAVDTNTVGCIKDIGSGANRDFTQATSGSRPTLSSTGGYHLDFDGTDDGLNRSAAGCMAAGACTIVVAVKSDNTAQTNRQLIAEGVNSGNAVYNPYGRIAATAQQRQANITNDGNTSALNTSSITATPFDGNWNVYYVEDTGSNIKVTVINAGAQVNNGSGSNYTRSSTYTLNRTGLGETLSSSASRFFQGKIGRVIEIGRLLTGAIGTAATEKDNAVKWVAAPQSIVTP